MRLDRAIWAATLLAGVAASQQDPRFVERTFASVPEGIEVDFQVVFAPDGSRAAFVGKRNGKTCPVVEGEVGPEFDFIDPPAFGPTGAQLAFRVGDRTSKKAETWWVWIDGKKTEKNDWIGALSWSPDGRKLAYWTQPGAKLGSMGEYTGGSLVLVVDGKKGAKYRDADALTPPVWSRDSKLVATAAMKDTEWLVLVGDKEVARSPMASSVAISDDGKRFACAVMKPFEHGGMDAPPTMRMSWQVVRDKKTYGAEFESAATPVLSADGKRLAFKALREGRVRIVVDEKPSKLDWTLACTPVFSPDGKRIAYAGVEGGEIDPFWIVSREGDWASKGGAWKLVVDDAAAEESFDELRNITFSPDAKQVAVRARSGEKWSIVCGERRSEMFDAVGPPLFADDGTQLAFGARNGRELTWRVMSLR